MSGFSDTNNIPTAIDGLPMVGRRASVEVAQEIVERIEQGFRRGQDALGNPWEPLSPETIRRKGNSQILVESGDLASSFKVERTVTGARVISRDPLARIHETGIPERRLPARPIMAPAEVWARRNALGGTILGRIFRLIQSLLL